MEPNFARRGLRAFISGGLSGALILCEKGWLGHKELLFTKEMAQSVGLGGGVTDNVALLAFPRDQSIKSCSSGCQNLRTLPLSHLAVIDRPADSPRADLFKLDCMVAGLLLSRTNSFCL